MCACRTRIVESLLRGISTLYLFFSRAFVESRIFSLRSFLFFFLISLSHSLHARTNKASGDKWRGRGINAARHKASPEHPSRSRRWRHWQWKVELWLKIEGLRKNSFKSTVGGDVRGDAERWGPRGRSRVAKRDREDLPAWNIAFAASDSYMTFPKGTEESPQHLSLAHSRSRFVPFYKVSSSSHSLFAEEST